MCYEHALGTSNIMTVASLSFYKYFIWSDVAPSVTMFGGCRNARVSLFFFPKGVWVVVGIGTRAKEERERVLL